MPVYFNGAKGAKQQYVSFPILMNGELFVKMVATKYKWTLLLFFAKCFRDRFLPIKN